MRYDVHLKVRYEYAEDVADARHVLHVRPRSFAFQRRMAVAVAIDPRPDEWRHHDDFFGNTQDVVALARPHRHLKLDMTARIEVERACPVLGDTPTTASLAVAARRSTDMGSRSPVWFLGPSRRVRAFPALAAFAQDLLGASERPSGSAILDLATAIRRDFAYRPGSTDVGTTVQDAFESRAGVCQDFAHVMIAALRSVGIPAGYVSGFLRTDPPAGKARLAGADAMHAWVTVWLGPALGWCDFDPTNGIAASRDHITVAVGRDYDDVTPIAGVLTTSGRQTTSHSVDVVPADGED